MMEKDLVCRIMEIIPEFNPSNEKFISRPMDGESVELESVPD
jgi:hypothetical protein